MYKHILLPVDGSDFGMGVIPHAIDFAKAAGARITAINVTAPYESVATAEIGAYLSAETYRTRTSEAAATILHTVKDAGAAAGVPVAAYQVPHIHPWEAIIQTAKEQGADLIIMASHGRRGLVGLLIGSETKKVLTHSTLPVLVWRA